MNLYFNKQLQEEILLKFYECLNPGGYLVLGMVETLIGSAPRRFKTVNNKLRIYQRSDIKKEGAVDGSILSQDVIDDIVSQMLDEE